MRGPKQATAGQESLPPSLLLSAHGDGVGVGGVGVPWRARGPEQYPRDVTPDFPNKPCGISYFLINICKKPSIKHVHTRPLHHLPPQIRKKNTSELIVLIVSEVGGNEKKALLFAEVCEQL